MTSRRTEDASAGQLLRLLVEQTREFAIILLDVDGRVTGWNKGAEHVFGIAHDDAIGRPGSLVFTEQDIARGTPVQEVATAEADTAAEDDRWLARADGSRFWATGVMIPLHDDQGRLAGFGKILRNRTDLREQIEALRNQLEASNAIIVRKDTFLSTLAHELRNPLAPLLHAIEIIRRRVAAGAAIEDTLGLIARQVAILMRLVDELLDLARINAGKIMLEKERIALRRVVDRAVESASPLVQERRQQLKVLFPSAAIVVDADPARLIQVFVNLITNAAKFTPPGGHIWVKGGTEGDEGVVRVADDGIGIAHDMMPHIFDLFTQAESSRNQSRGGLGIGLALVKDIVTLHGGSVQVSSEGAGKGSNFSVRLPLAQS
jgi:two-component system CheB/CheR fusion protein